MDLGHPLPGAAQQQQPLGVEMALPELDVKNVVLKQDRMLNASAEEALEIVILANN